MNGKQMEGVRQRRSREEVERLVDEYEASGLGRQEFCKQHGLSLSTLNRHRKRKQVRQEKQTSGRRFIPIEISAAKQQPSKERCGELLVWLSSGRRIEVRGGFDAKVLEQLVRLLESV
jgi:transposase-like protein